MSSRDDASARPSVSPAEKLERGPASQTPLPGPRAAVAAPRELGGRLAGLSLPRQVYILAIWPFLGQVLNFLVGSVDTALAGRLSVEATNAISVASYFGWLFGIVFMSVGNGSAALIARAVGGRHKRLANAALGQSMLISGAVGLAMLLIIFISAPWLIGVIGLTGESFDKCVIYLRITAVAAPFAAVLFIGSACLRGAGDTRTPFYVLLVVNIVNMLLSVMLVMAPEPIGGWNVTGIAVGTLVAWLVGSLLTVYVLINGWGGIRLRWIRLRPHWHTAWRILRVGGPSFAEGFLAMWLANFIIIKMLGWLGDPAAWGAHMIAVRIEGLSFLTAFAIGAAAATLAGQYLGADNPDRAKAAANLCWAIAVGFSGLLGLVFIFFPEPLVRLYTDQPELLTTSPPLLELCGYVQVFFASAIVLGQTIRGAGDTRTALYMTAFSTYFVRLPLAYFMGVYLGYGLTGVWYGLCIELAFRGSLFTARYLQGGWQRVQV